MGSSVVEAEDSRLEIGTTGNVDGDIDATNSPLIMGILNITSDSFSDGDKYYCTEDAVKHAMDMINNGADIIDIGAESTRPGAKPVDSATEISKLLPVLKELKSLMNEHDSTTPCPLCSSTETSPLPSPKGEGVSRKLISIDTYKSQTAKAVLDIGIDIINDIYALQYDKEMVHVLRDYPQTKVVLVHKVGTPENMQDNPQYEDIIFEITDFFKERIDFCLANGISANRLIIDPGIGFGKTFEHNIEILKSLDEFKALGIPILLGASRKSFINQIYPSKPQDRLVGSLATTVVAFMKNIDIIRVHDVKEHNEMIKSLSWMV